MKALIIFVGCVIISFAILLFYIAFTPSYKPDRTIITQQKLNNLEIAIIGFYNKYLKFPKGNSSEIIDVLSGNDELQNPDNIIFLEILRDNSSDHDKHKRNYLDSWGSPFIFKFNTENIEFEINSFGPNKTGDNGKGDDMILEKRIL